MSAGYDSALLVATSGQAVIDIGGAQTAVTGLDTVLIRAVRARADGFWVVKDDSTGWRRYRIGWDGKAAVEARYGALPAEWSVASSTLTEPLVMALDGRGTFYVGAVSSDDTAIFALAPDGTTVTRVYAESQLPAEDWNDPVRPPKVRAHLFMPLVLTGP
jgi:hypothetical protein